MKGTRWLTFKSRWRACALMLVTSAASSLSLTGCFFSFHQWVQQTNPSSTFGAAKMLMFSTEPSSTNTVGSTFGSMPVVEVVDSNSNLVLSASNSVTLAAYTDSGCTVMAGGTLTATANPISAMAGVANYSGITYTGSAPVTIYLGATSSGLVSACSSAVTINPGAPVSLTFSTEPSASVGSGVVFSTQPVLELKDAYGNIVTTASNSITLAAYSDNSCTTAAPGTFGATTNPLAASGGVASFAGVNYVGAAGSTIYLGASSGGMTACSSSISITPGNPVKLIFSTQPADPSATAGVALATQPAITVEDSYGNTVTTATNSITLAPYTNSTCTTAGTGTLGATTNPLTPTSGVATFAGVNYTKSGTFYIGASASGVTSACSNAISVAAGPPAQLGWESTPSNWQWVNQCDAGVQVKVEDQYGNTAIVSGSAVTVNWVPGGSETFYSDSSCTTSITSSTISVGASYTPAVFIKDTVSEKPSDYATAVAAGLTQTSTTNITWGVNAKITSYSSTSFSAGTCQQVTVTFEDNNGATTAIGGGTNSGDICGIDAGSTQLYSDSACTTAMGCQYFSTGATGTTFYAKDVRAESFDPYFYWGQTSGYIVEQSLTATQLGTTVTVNPDPLLALILTGPTFEPPGTCVPLTVTGVDVYGNPYTISGSPLTVNLSTSGTAQIFSDSGCTVSTANVSIAVGSYSQPLYVKDAATETSTITATATGYTTGTFNLDSTTTSLVTDVATVGNFTCAVVGGAVKCWGDNGGGNLGNGTTTSSLAPVSVSGISNAKTVVVGEGGSTAADWACALETDNTVWCWGNTTNGGTTTPSEVKVSGSPLLANSISMIQGNACAAATSGALYCWGTAYSSIYTGAPTEVLATGVIGNSDDPYCVILTGGELYCWGGNGDGQVGNGNTAGQSSPVQVVGLTSGVTEAAYSAYNGYYARCALKSGAVYCWGWGVNDELANNNGGSSLTPVASSESPLTSGVLGLYGNYAYNSFCAISSAGALYCWGSAMGGGTGMGGYNTTTIVQTLFTSGVTYYTGGIDSPMAYTAGSSDAQCVIVSGNLECWGNSVDGGLGTGNISPSRTTPIYPMSLE